MFELRHIQKVTGGVTALEIDELAVREGEIAAVVGSRGSGLGELRDLLIGRTQPTAGTVRVAGIDPARDHESFSRRVGVLFADNALYAHRSPRKHLVFDCRLRGLDRARIATVLSAIGLTDHADVGAAKLTPGLQRRLAFGRAVLHAPPALLLIEPFRDCDDATIHLLARQIRTRAGENAAVLIMARDVARLRQLCQVLHLLERGRIVESRKPEEDAATPLPLKIPVKLADEVVLINPVDILFAAAYEGRSALRLAGGPKQKARDLPTQFTLSELETRLARRGFFRAHRSYLVNLQHVKSVIPYTRNAYSLILDDEEESEIPLSRASAAELRDLLGY
jgi:ABC-2 type transport system ATP-binding protein